MKNLTIRRSKANLNIQKSKAKGLLFFSIAKSYERSTFRGNSQLRAMLRPRRKINTKPLIQY
ncbi:MAG: hypothetical protein DMF76_20375 [Acidobacteria bacterium]|nr:MAG: hypothetical protein DMF76_20375 [Acidobacteriota bacterium]